LVIKVLLSRWCQILLELRGFKCSHTHTHKTGNEVLQYWESEELSGLCHGKGIPSARGGDYPGLGLRSRQMTDRG